MFTKRELLVIELGLYERQRFLVANLNTVPGASEKLQEVNSLIEKVKEL